MNIIAHKAEFSIEVDYINFRYKFTKKEYNIF